MDSYDTEYLRELHKTTEQLLKSSESNQDRDRAINADSRASDALKKASRFLKSKPENTDGRS